MKKNPSKVLVSLCRSSTVISFIPSIPFFLDRILNENFEVRRYITCNWGCRRHHKELVQRSLSLCFEDHPDFLCQGRGSKEPLQPINLFFISFLVMEISRTSAATSKFYTIGCCDDLKI